METPLVAPPRRPFLVYPNGCVGGAQDFAGPLNVPHSIVSDDAFVYWAEKTSVWRLAK